MPAVAVRHKARVLFRLIGRKRFSSVGLMVIKNTGERSVEDYYPSFSNRIYIFRVI